MEFLRAFFAVNLTENNQQRIKQYINDVKLIISEKLTWVEPSKIHLTLQFLGSTTLENINSLIRILNESLIQIQPFCISFTDIGAFPSTTRPRVIWIGVKPEKGLSNLIRIIDEASEKCGYKMDERRITPHLTIARIKKSMDYAEILSIGELIAKTNIPQLDQQLIQKFDLMRSVLYPSGPEYSKLHEFKISQRNV